MRPRSQQPEMVLATDDIVLLEAELAAEGDCELAADRQNPEYHRLLTVSFYRRQSPRTGFDRRAPRRSRCWSFSTLPFHADVASGLH